MSGTEIYEDSEKTCFQYYNYYFTIYYNLKKCIICKNNKKHFFGDCEEYCLNCCNINKRLLFQNITLSHIDIKNRQAYIYNNDNMITVKDEFTYFYSLFLRECYYDCKANGIFFSDNHCAFKLDSHEIMIYLSNYKPFEENKGLKRLYYNFHSSNGQYIPYNEEIDSYEIIETFKKKIIEF